MIPSRKVLIVTCDEDLVQNIISLQPERIHFIDVDEQNSSAVNDRTFLTQLLEPNNTCELAVKLKESLQSTDRDQGQKRPSDSWNLTPVKPIKNAKKTIDSRCVVCEDRATGFHYGIVTCDACKVFFSRNAFQSIETMHCLHGQNRCPISRDIRRKCKKCRLIHCFQMGMQKDYFLSESEKQRRRERVQNNDVVLSNITFCGILSSEDWSVIEKIQLSYSQHLQHRSSPCSYELLDQLSALIYWSQTRNETAINLIRFSRDIDEFELLNSTDRFTLIKYNFLVLSFVITCFKYDPLVGLYSEFHNETWDAFHRLVTIYRRKGDFYEILDAKMQLLFKVTGQEPVVLCLLVIILLFSKGVSISDEEPPLNDPLAVHRAQSHYTILLWNYLIHKQGEQKTIKQFIDLTYVILQIQSTIKDFRTFISTQLLSPETIDQVPPMIQSMLNIM